MYQSVIGLSAAQREEARRERMARGILTTIEAAEYLGTTQRTLDWLRCKGKGPAYHKDSRFHFYMKDELDAYRASRGQPRRGSSSMAEKERASPVTTPARP